MRAERTGGGVQHPSVTAGPVTGTGRVTRRWRQTSAGACDIGCRSDVSFALYRERTHNERCHLDGRRREP